MMGKPEFDTTGFLANVIFVAMIFFAALFTLAGGFEAAQ